MPIAFAAATCIALSSCDSLGIRLRSPITKVVKERRFGPGKLTSAAIQSELMSFADTFNAAIAEQWNQVAAEARADDAATDPESADRAIRLRRTALENKIASVSAALSIASSPNPTVALADMITMIRLQRLVLESPATAERLGAETSARLVAAYKGEEEKLSHIAAQAMSQAQRDELDQLITDWRAENPDARYVANVRLEDFAKARQQTFVTDKSKDSLWSLVALDPLAGLDPAQREVERSRMLGERIFYFGSRWPQVLKWHAESLSQELLGAPQIERVLEAARSGTETAARISRVAEHLREDIAAERSAALEDFFTRVADERRATIADVSAALDAQRGALIRDLDQVKDTAAVTGDAASALTETIHAASSFTTQLREHSGSASDTADSGKHGLAEFQAAAAQTAETADRLNGLVRSVDELLAAPELDEKRAALHGVVLDARSNAEGVIAYAAKWLIVLMIATVLAVTLSVVAYRRFGRPASASTIARTRSSAPLDADRPAIT